MITILTPTFNRRHTLGRLYESLCNQDCFDFEWLIIDDGSTDNTKSDFETLQETRFNVKYYYKENGGKHRAINFGIKYAIGEWILILDSDDLLTPNAISIIKEQTAKIELDKRYCGITGLKIDLNHNTIGTKCKYEVLDTDNISYRTKYKIIGDRAEVFRTSILKQYPFPEFKDEKFCTEAIVWNRIASKYITRYINQGFYICEYQSNGLTNKYWELMDENPKSSMLYYKEFLLYKQTSFRYKIISYIYYKHYKKLVNKHNIIKYNLRLPIHTELFYEQFRLLYEIYKYIKHKMKNKHYY